MRLLRFLGYDETRLAWGCTEWHARKQEFVNIWLNMVGGLRLCVEDIFEMKDPEAKTCHILIHCYGGVNRSTAAVCAVLMNFCGLSLRRALMCVLKERASLQPFQKRDYMLVGLLDLERMWNVDDEEDKHSFL